MQATSLVSALFVSLLLLGCATTPPPHPAPAAAVRLGWEFPPSAVASIEGFHMQRRLEESPGVPTWETLPGTVPPAAVGEFTDSTVTAGSAIATVSMRFTAPR